MFSNTAIVSRLRASTLCQRDLPVSTAWQAIGWWEARRVAFNLVIGGAGILSGLVAVLAVVIYAIFANICYTGGWIVELVIRQAWPEQADRFATLTLALGIIFAIALTLSPGALVGAVGLFGAAGHLLGIVHSPRN